AKKTRSSAPQVPPTGSDVRDSSLAEHTKQGAADIPCRRCASRAVTAARIHRLRPLARNVAADEFNCVDFLPSGSFAGIEFDLHRARVNSSTCIKGSLIRRGEPGGFGA